LSLRLLLWLTESTWRGLRTEARSSWRCSATETNTLLWLLLLLSPKATECGRRVESSSIERHFHVGFKFHDL
jgi:hypothetical protein